MIPTDILRDLTDLTSPQLYHLRKLGLIPRPTRIPTIGHAGSSYGYPAAVLNRIRLIKILRAKGIPLTKIARAARGTPFECQPPAPSPDRNVKP